MGFLLLEVRSDGSLLIPYIHVLADLRVLSALNDSEFPLLL